MVKMVKTWCTKSAAVIPLHSIAKLGRTKKIKYESECRNNKKTD